MNPTLAIGATGFGLIAVCYGFARFAFGLFLPQIDADLLLGPALSGVISGGSFLGYCVAIVAAAQLTERVGARRVAIAAALVAAAGMIGIALAPSASWLAAAVMLAGSSTGLASPPLAAAVAAAVHPSRQDATNTVVNAGTSAGVALSGPMALAMGVQWRLAFAVFAAPALLLAVAAAVALPPPRREARRQGEPRGLPAFTSPVLALVAASFLTGVASTAVWSFGGELAASRFGWQSDRVGVLWIAIGAAGIVGASAGQLVARFGIDKVHRVFLAVMAAGTLAVGAAVSTPALTLAGGALFGAAYVLLTGVYLVWGVRAVPGRPATGLMVGFLTIAVGQTAGAPLFGLLLDRLGAGPATAAFAVTAILAGVFPARRVAPLACA